MIGACRSPVKRVRGLFCCPITSLTVAFVGTAAKLISWFTAPATTVIVRVTGRRNVMAGAVEFSYTRGSQPFYNRAPLQHFDRSA